MSDSAENLGSYKKMKVCPYCVILCEYNKGKGCELFKLELATASKKELAAKNAEIERLKEFEVTASQADTELAEESKRLDEVENLKERIKGKDATIAKMVESARLLCQRVDMCERGVAEYTELWGLNGDLKSKLQEIAEQPPAPAKDIRHVFDVVFDKMEGEDLATTGKEKDRMFAIVERVYREMK